MLEYAVTGSSPGLHGYAMSEWRDSIRFWALALDVTMHRKGKAVCEQAPQAELLRPRRQMKSESMLSFAHNQLRLTILFLIF